MRSLILVFLISGVSFFALAGTAEDIAKVKKMAHEKIRGQDVRKSVEVYNNVDQNPCAEEGITYIVKIQVRSPVIEMKNDEPVQVSQWQDLNTYRISKASLDAGQGLTDSICME